MSNQRTIVGGLLGGLIVGGLAHYSTMKGKVKIPWAALAAGAAAGAGVAYATSESSPKTSPAVAQKVAALSEEVRAARDEARIARAKADTAAAEAREAREETEQARGRRRQEYQSARREHHRAKRFGETVEVQERQNEVVAKGGVVHQAAYEENAEGDEPDFDFEPAAAGRIAIGRLA